MGGSARLSLRHMLLAGTAIAVDTGEKFGRHAKKA